MMTPRALRLCVLVTVVVGLLEARGVPLSGNEVWLAELEDKVRTADVQADSAGLLSNEPVVHTCPRVVDDFYDYDCSQPPCLTDDDCSGPAQMCCSNGCVRTCIHKSNPPLLVDWVLYPGRSPSGYSWLLSGPKPVVENDEYCSTSLIHENSTPLNCPDTYVCHIEDMGNPKKNIPNRGRCVEKEHLRTFDSDNFVKQKLLNEDSNNEHRGCLVHETVYAYDTRFYKDGRPCVCRNGVLSCYRKVIK